ncbi:MAG: ABC transporter substrate-binding protein [Acidobacteriota bacterium]
MRRAHSFSDPVPPQNPSTGRSPLGALAARLLPALLALLLACAPGGGTPAGSTRWVSLAPSMTEILFAIGAGQQVAGVCEPADRPPEAASLPRVASWERLDVEAVVALRPSACFTVTGMQTPSALASLERFGIPVYAYQMESLEDVFSAVESVGRRTGRAGDGRRLAEAYRARVRAAGRRLPPGPPERALAVVGLNPLVVAGGPSFLTGVLKAAGFENALGGRGEGYPVVSLEDAAAAAPDAVVFPEGEMSPEAVRRFLERLQEASGRTARAIPVPADLLVRPGPGSVEAVERLARQRRAGGAP